MRMLAAVLCGLAAAVIVILGVTWLVPGESCTVPKRVRISSIPVIPELVECD